MTKRMINGFRGGVFQKKISKQILGSQRLLFLQIFLVMMLLVPGSGLTAATQAEINASTQAGVQWLVAQQQANGSWTGGYAAETGFAVGVLAHYAEKLGKTPLDPTYIYSTNVQNGLNYLFSSATYDSANSWVYWNVGGNNSYQTGPCLMGIARSGAPDAVVNVSGCALNGFTYKQVAQMAVDWLGSAQITTGNGTGAWYYNKGSTTGDQSAAGWVTLGLGYAAHSMECTLPAGLLTRLATWNEFIQCHTAGADYGGAAYTSSYMGWYNVYKTGHLLFAHGLCGNTVSHARVQEALTFMDAHWNDLTNGSGSVNDYGWRGNPGSGIRPSYIAIAAAAKGFTELEIETFSGHDWYNDFADVVVDNQYPDGHWLGGGHGETNNRSTCWALLGLLRATSHFPPVVTTNAASSVAPFSATLNGNLTDMGTAASVDLSFQYGTTSGSYSSETTPVSYSSGVPHAFSQSISGLSMGTRYYFRAKAAGDAVGYGDELYFDTLPVPTVTTTAVTDITNVSAVSGGNVTADNGTPVTARGVCWSTSPNPTIADSHTTDGTGTGSFSSSLSSLSGSTTYHVRAYATNTAGTGYGADITFTTSALVTASAGANGSLDPSTPSPVVVGYGNNTSFQFNADTGYHVATVSGCSGSAYSNTSNGVSSYTYTTGSIVSDCTVAATFAINTYTITASAGAHGSITPSGVTSVNHGGSQLYSIVPATGYHIVDVLVDGSSEGAISSYNFTNVTENHTISATFAINTYTVSASAGANGALNGGTPSPVTVNHGDTATFTFNADTGYHVASVSGCSGTDYNNTSNAVNTYTYTTGAITGDCTVTATFAINSYTVTASAGANGALDGGTPSPVSVNHGDTTSFTFNANTGYHVASVSGCSGSAYTNTSNGVSTYTYTTGVITGDCTVTAAFAINQYTVTASAGANGTLNGGTPSPVTVNHGSTTSFTFNADTGYHVASVSGCSGSAYTNTSNGVSTYTYTSGAITGDCTVTAAFAINQYTVTASAGANGALDGGTPSPVTVDHGDTTSFTFNADTGYHVASVSGCSGTEYSNTSNAVNTYTYTTGAITGDCTVTAAFSINQYTVTASAGANGALDGGTPSPVTVNHGDTTSFTFNADTGYHVASVSGCSGTEYSNTSNAVNIYTYTTGAITGDCTVTAAFSINQYQVTAIAEANGTLDSGTPSPVIVNYGNTATFTFNADTGYHIESISGCAGAAFGNTTNEVNTYTYTTGAITGDCIVDATFAINVYQVRFTHSTHGHLDGTLSQTREHGQNCSSVTAVPDLGYRLLEWTGDYIGNDNPLRICNVRGNMNVNGVFHNDPPLVNIVSPAGGVPIFGVIAVEAEVSDDTRVARVEFYVDGELIEQKTASQAKSRPILLPASGTMDTGKSQTQTIPNVTDYTLHSGAFQFDLSDAQAVFLSAEGKARKMDGSGRISPIISPDADVTCLRLLPQTDSLALAFREPQVLGDGKEYSLILVDFRKETLIGLESAPVQVISDFSTSPVFQTDGMNHVYYFVANAHEGMDLRVWDHQAANTLLVSEGIVLEWRVARDGAVIMQKAPVTDGPCMTHIWHPLSGWIGEDLVLLSDETRRQWSRVAISRNFVLKDRLESYFPPIAEIPYSGLDAIHSVSIRNNLVLISGLQGDSLSLKLLDREKNTCVMVPTANLEIRETTWLSDRDALLVGVDRVTGKVILASLQWEPGLSPEIREICVLNGMPRQIQGVKSNALFDMGSVKPGHTVDKRGESLQALSDFPWQTLDTRISSDSSSYIFLWDSMNHSVGDHILRVVAYDDVGAAGSDEVTAAVARVNLDLLAERREAVAFSILRHYGQIQFLVDDFGIQVSEYRILRRQGDGEFELLKSVAPGELQNSRFEMQDKYLESGTLYTYRVEAYNAEGHLLGISMEKTI